jgi:hypothetical protein
VLTISELKERMLQEYDEVTLLEILDVSAKDIVEAFHDKIEDRFDQLLQEFEGEEE